MKYIQILFFSLLSMQTMQSASAYDLIARGMNRLFDMPQSRIDVAKMALRKSGYDIADACAKLNCVSEDDFVLMVLCGGKIISDVEPIIESVRTGRKIYFQDSEALRSSLALDLGFFRHRVVQEASGIIYKDAGERCLETVKDLTRLSRNFDDCIQRQTSLEVSRLQKARNLSKADSEALVSLIHRNRFNIFQKLAIIESTKVIDTVNLAVFIDKCDEFITNQKSNEFISIIDAHDIILNTSISARNRLYKILLDTENIEAPYKFAVSTHSKPSAEKILRAFPVIEEDAFLYKDLDTYTKRGKVSVAIEYRLQ